MKCSSRIILENPFTSNTAEKQDIILDIKQFYISCAVINRLFSKYIGHDFDLL